MTDFSKPIAVSQADAAFGNVENLLPKYEDIPKEFRDFNGVNKWHKFQSDWFFFGLKNLEATMKPGINKQDALRHLGCINGSFDPKHEHKKAAVAYLASLWFEDIQYEVNLPAK